MSYQECRLVWRGKIPTQILFCNQSKQLSPFVSLEKSSRFYSCECVGIDYISLSTVKSYQEEGKRSHMSCHV